MGKIFKSVLWLILALGAFVGTFFIDSTELVMDILRYFLYSVSIGFFCFFLSSTSHFNVETPKESNPIEKAKATVLTSVQWLLVLVLFISFASNAVWYLKFSIGAVILLISVLEIIVMSKHKNRTLISNLKNANKNSVSGKDEKKENDTKAESENKNHEKIVVAENLIIDEKLQNEK